MCPTSPDEPAAEMGNTSAVEHREWNYLDAQIMSVTSLGLRSRQPHMVLMVQLAHSVGGSGVRLVQEQPVCVFRQTNYMACSGCFGLVVSTKLMTLPALSNLTMLPHLSLNTMQGRVLLPLSCALS